MARRIEGNFNQGWGIAALITLLAAAGCAPAFTINKRTYQSPNDVTAPTESAESHTPAPAAAKH
jgi:hypothetical protein